MSIWGKIGKALTPKLQIAAITDEVVERLVTQYDIMWEVDLKDNKVIINPIIKRKGTKVELPNG